MDERGQSPYGLIKSHVCEDIERFGRTIPSTDCMLTRCCFGLGGIAYSTVDTFQYIFSDTRIEGMLCLLPQEITILQSAIRQRRGALRTTKRCVENLEIFT